MSKTKAGIILSAALLIGNAFQFFQSIIVAHFFAPEILAPYKYGVLVVGFFPLASLGMIDSIFYFISGKYEKTAGKYVGYTLVFCTAISLSILLVFHLILKPHILIHTELAPYLDEVGAYVYIGSFIFINLTAHNALVGYNQVLIASQLRVCQIGVRFIAIAFTLYFGLIHDIYTFILLLVALEIGQSILYTGVLIRKNLLSFDLKNIDKMAQINYSIVLGITRFVPFLGVNIDKIMISLLMGPTSFAIFSVAAVELPLAGIVISVFGSVLFSTYVAYAEKQDTQKIVALWYKSSVRGMAVNVPVGVSIFFYSDVLFRLILPGSYYEGHQVLGVYALLLLLRFNDTDVLAKVMNKNTIILKASILVLVTNIIGTFIFIKWFGLWGAALATLCGLAAAWIYYLFSYARLLNTRPSQIFPGKIYAILVGISVTFFGMSKVMIHHIGVSIALVILGGVVYIYYVFTILDQSERDYILTRIKRR